MADPPDTAAPPDPVPSPPPPTIHEAELASGPSGIVYWGAAIDFATAVLRRSVGEDVVVRGDDLDANRALALAIEATVGVAKRGDPHKQHAGPHALPHFQQGTPPPRGHTFYETEKRRARKRP
jgi:hypothetical protein